VYGTEVPSYTVTSSFEPHGDGTMGHFKVVQSGVSEDFRMLVPIYLELENKQVVMVGQIVIKGPHEVEQKVTIGKMPSPPKRFLVNYNYDILSAN
jgi:hypothetical protein